MPGYFEKSIINTQRLALFIIYGHLTLKAFLQFRPDWDFLSYHLPNALQRWGLTSFRETPRLYEFNLGFPPLAHYLQGALVYFTGRISAANFLNAFMFLLMCVFFYLLFRSCFSWRIFFSACLGIPMFVLHYGSGYVDLFTACFIVIAFSGLVLIASRTDTFSWTGLAIVISGCVGAMLSKMQAWPVVLVLYITSILYIYFCRIDQVRCFRFCTTALLFGFAIAYWPLRNLYLFSNPTYSVSPPLLGSYFPNVNVEPNTSDPDVILPYKSYPNIARFAISAFELNRFYRSDSFTDTFSWTIDASAEKGKVSPHYRMGGWNGFTFILLLGSFSYLLYKRQIYLLPGLVFVSVVLVVAICPNSNEMRYWLFIPLTLTMLVATANGVSKQFNRFLNFAFTALAAYTLFVLWPFSLDTRLAVDYAPEEAVQYWKRIEEKIITGEKKVSADTICNKAPYTIFWSGPTFQEYRVRDCE